MISLLTEIRAATERSQHEAGMMEENLPTAADLARQFNLRLDTVKKKLRLLKEWEVVQAIGHQPKRYRFNPWVLKSLDGDSPLAQLLAEFQAHE